MAFAMQFPEVFKAGRKKKGEIVDSNNHFDKSLLSRARYVLRNNPVTEGQRYPQRCLAIMAGVVPPVVVTDIDPSLAVLRSNYSTRTASDGQKAMAYAMQFPEAKRGAHSHLKNLSGTLQVYLSNARYVRRNNPIPEDQKHPQICHDVVNGLITLSDAFKQTQVDVKRREEEEATRKANAEKLADVRGSYPDLAALVVLREEFSDLAALVDAAT